MTTNVQSMAYLMTETNNCVMTQKTGLKYITVIRIDRAMVCKSLQKTEWKGKLG